MAFYPGQQVVCINTRFLPDARNDHLYMLQDGRIYTIRDVVDSPHYSTPSYGLRLEGVRMPACAITGMEQVWHPYRFRPCAKTDISIFADMLEKIPESADA